MPEEIDAFSLLFSLAAMASAVMSGPFRWDQGFRELKKKELDSAEQVEAVNGGDHLHTGVFPDDPFHLRGRFLRDIQGGVVRQLHTSEQIALVFIGKETGGDEFGQRKEQGGHGGQQQDGQPHAADQPGAGIDVPVPRLVESLVEYVEKGAQQPDGV